MTWMAGTSPAMTERVVTPRPCFDLKRTIEAPSLVASALDRNRDGMTDMDAAHARRPNVATELALLFLLATLWGASYTFIKLGVATIPPITLIAARTSIAGLLLLIIMRWRGVTMPRDLPTWRRFLFQACLNSVVPWTLIAWGERLVDAGLATILNSAAPIFTFLFTALVTRHEAATPRKLFGVVAGMAGICLIVGVDAFGGIGRGLLAEAVIVAATICYAGAAVFSRGFKGLDPMAPAAGSLLAGAAILVPASLVIERPWMLAPSASSILALLGLAAFSTAAAFVIYFRLIQTLGSVGTTAQAYLRVPIGVAISVVFLGERLSSTAWVGLACVVMGVAAMTIPPRKTAVAKAA
jgi:drug/metabolite transporter (DMT)-like permease